MTGVRYETRLCILVVGRRRESLSAVPAKLSTSCGIECSCCECRLICSQSILSKIAWLRWYSVLDSSCYRRFWRYTTYRRDSGKRNGIFLFMSFKMGCIMLKDFVKGWRWILGEIGWRVERRHRRERFQRPSIFIGVDSIKHRLVKFSTIISISEILDDSIIEVKIIIINNSWPWKSFNSRLGLLYPCNHGTVSFNSLKSQAFRFIFLRRSLHSWRNS